ncbi:capZ-interacting protein isoform X1 [Dasypus novemcinctus]|uniref:capZ-interacting protein isoform X1 n=1 Tax=Dasypus novemcinctus TaxID=9361 RepID=UPI0003CC196A|nr:capZ-interacting protein isoform X2 [Dasypus novemcinctus]XP_058166055.1 capZ-interacting protein isoform X2 [Dasypus novemcinctus]
MEERPRPAENNANVDSSASPSVAQLAGRFREQAAAAKETPSSKPARRKVPCSLLLFPPKVELGQNGEEKSSPNASHPPKIKVKSSPLIEKLQANLAFDPAALLPGASPKSPGPKATVSPFHSPPSTPSSPGVWSRSSEPEEVPVSFDQPPEGSHLPCYNKVRTRGSLKRRPPSRRFRRSQSDCEDLSNFRAAESSQENGAEEDNGKTPGSPPSSDGVEEEGSRNLGSSEKPPLRRTPSRTEKREKDGVTEEAKQCEKAEENHQSPAQEEATGPPQVPSPTKENGCGSPVEEKPAGEETQTEKSTEGKQERAGSEEDEPGQKSRGTEKPVESAAGKETFPNTPGEMEGGKAPEQETEKEKPAEGEVVLQPDCIPGTGQAQLEPDSEVLSRPAAPEAENESRVQDTRM